MSQNFKPRDPAGLPPQRDSHCANFRLAQTELRPLQNQEVLVRNLFMSVAYMARRMNDGKSYVPPFELGQTVDGGAVGQVVESRRQGIQAGDAVTSNSARNIP